MLAIGATGMLANASRALGRDSQHLTLFARRPRFLAERLGAEGMSVGYFEVDYHDRQALRFALVRAQQQHGEADLALCWVHSSASEAIPEIAASVGAKADIVQVLGSASRPLSDLGNSVCKVRDARVRRVVLGCRHEDGGLRWLTHSEISAGVLDAIHTGAALSVVGSLDCPPQFEIREPL